MQVKEIKFRLTVICIFILFFSISKSTMAQENRQMTRLAIIRVDPLQLDKYKIALREQMTAAILQEPGVLSYTAVADKSDPSHITIFEIYADTAAYQTHIKTSHFLKYKDTVKDMVQSLELVDVLPVASAKKPGF